MLALAFIFCTRTVLVTHIFQPVSNITDSQIMDRSTPPLDTSGRQTMPQQHQQ